MSRSLLEHEARLLLRDNELPVQDYEFCTSLEDAVAAAGRIGFPVVLKIVSPDIVHKSDAGGVRLNLRGEAELRQAFTEIMELEAEIRGVLVCPFVEGAVELIVGAINDPQFGPVVMVGLGGVFVEIFKDVSFGITPVDKEEAREMLQNLQAYPLIEGVRGRRGLDEEGIVELIVKVSAMVQNYSIEELDLNPVFCFPDGVEIGDARVLMGD